MSTLESSSVQPRSSDEGMAANLMDVLESRAIRQPDQVAYIYLPYDGSEDQRLTYAELDQTARGVAAFLQSESSRGERVLLAYPPGIDFVVALFGCLYAGVIPIPSSVPTSGRNIERLMSIIADAQPSIALTNEETLSVMSNPSVRSSILESTWWASTDRASTSSEAGWKRQQVSDDALALIQYTSGSTAAPKGVMVSHANIMHNQRMIREAFNQSDKSLVVGWLPLYHDMGLIGAVFHPLYLGVPCVLMSPLSFLRRSIRWLQTISRFNATTSGGPNFAYELCVRNATPKDLEGLDLSCWSTAFNGSEPVRAETLDRFAGVFESCGFRRNAFFPCYGLAETTLIVSGGRNRAEPIIIDTDSRDLEESRGSHAAPETGMIQRLVSCGRVSSNCRVVIVNPELNTRCLENEIGEIWVAGPNVAAGYWGKEEETERIFGARLANSPDGPFLRTGDLGFLRDGYLFVTGRLKDLIIIRGVNHYPEDIERSVNGCHAALRDNSGAAFSVDLGGEELLVIVQEIQRAWRKSADSVIESIRQAIVERHQIDPYRIALIKAGGIPRTSSGKIRRRACRAEFLDGRLRVIREWRSNVTLSTENSIADVSTYSHTRESIEAWLVKCLTDRGGMKVPARVNVSDPISRYGVDSLLALKLLHSIETNFGVVMTMSGVLSGQNIAQLADDIFGRLTLEPSDIRPFLDHRAAPDKYPLSNGQRALWFLHQASPESPAYNIAAAVRISGDLDAEALRNALDMIIVRHRCLRTTFGHSMGEVFQVIHDSVETPLVHKDVSDWNEGRLKASMIAEAHRPFDLEKGPLMRMTHFRKSAHEHLILLTLHHIISDFWSIALLVHELGVIYQAEMAGQPAALSELKLQYADYVRWQNDMLEGEEGERLWSYWRSQLAGELPALNLPTDHPRPPVHTDSGASEPFRLNARLIQELKTLSDATNATLFMTMLAAFQALLHRYSGQSEILVGSPASGRSRPEFTGIIGYFVNPLVFRTSFADDPSYQLLLLRVRDTALAAFEHQEYPFSQLVSRLQPERDSSLSPIFQVFFVMHRSQLAGAQPLAAFALGEEGARMQLGELSLESIALEERVAPVDLTLVVAENEGELAGSLQYNSDLFESDTIVRMLSHFETMLEAIVSNPGLRISELQLLNRREIDQIIFEWNTTDVDFAADLTVQALFEAQVVERPDALAVVSEQDQLTYAEVNVTANHLAHQFIALNLQRGEFVAVYLERGAMVVPALLGILKAGCAYVPIEPGFPAERVRWILASLKVRCMVTQADRLPTLYETLGDLSTLTDLVCIDGGDSAGNNLSCHKRVWTRERLRELPVENPQRDGSSDDIAYVIFTSGSTGTPKGVMVQHKPVINLIEWVNRTFGMGPDDRVLFTTSLCFDLSVYDMFGLLAAGGTIRVASGQDIADPAKLLRIIAEEPITFWDSAPASLQQLVPSLSSKAFTVVNRNLRLVFLSGDWIPVHLPDAVRSVFRNARIVSLGGATEATVWSNFYPIDSVMPEWASIPYGKPIQNSQYYVLDSRLSPCPIGVEGDLYIGGKCLATGYINDPALTAEKFIPDPFRDEPWARLYRTGDRARFWSDGNIEFLGRIDHQVKIRGYRIELGEIETALNGHPDIYESVVIATNAGSGDRRLVCYLVLREDQALSTSEIRNYLLKKLPEYMAPSIYIQLEAMPVTPNGKIDRSALPSPNRDRIEGDNPFVAPRTPHEAKLTEIWSEVLGVEKVGVHDNFFELGGHSLLMIQAVARIRELFNVEIPIQTFFQGPTVADLATAVVQTQASNKNSDEIDYILNLLEQSSQDELESMLAKLSRAN